MSIKSNCVIISNSTAKLEDQSIPMTVGIPNTVGTVLEILFLFFFLKKGKWIYVIDENQGFFIAFYK